MVPPVPSAAAGRRGAPGPEPAPSRIGAFICILALYLAFAGTLIGLGYGLWAALAGATTACVVAGEVARRVITAGTAPAAGPGGTASAGGSALAELLRDISRALESGSGGSAAGSNRRDG